MLDMEKCSIDFSEQVINEMKKKTPRKKLKSGLKYEIMDMLHMTFSDDTYDAVLTRALWMRLLQIRQKSLRMMQSKCLRRLTEC